MIDLRSDTVTQPSASMRSAIAAAEVGDDVLGDDPTVNELQSRLATMLGKQAGLFVPSGTMSNAVAIRTHTSPGDEIITAADSHVYLYEGGGYAALSGCSIALVPTDRGIMAPEDVEQAIRKASGSLSHFPDGSLVCVENTANRGGGTVYPQPVLDRISEIAHDSGCSTHLDGARMFNAVVASGSDPARLASGYDSISICLSKGLGAPVGSVLLGSEEFISSAHRWRKLFGGGMRQAGVLAAAGLFALENNIERLADDHARALRLAEAVSALDGFSVDLDGVQTNMAYIGIEDGRSPQEIIDRLASHDVHLLSVDEHTLRAVTHLHVDDGDIDASIAAFSSIQTP